MVIALRTKSGIVVLPAPMKQFSPSANSNLVPSRESPDDRDAPDSVRVEAVIHGYPCNRYKQKSRRLLAFSRGVVTPLVTPRKKLGKLYGYFRV